MFLPFLFFAPSDATSQLAASLPPGALQPWSKDLTFYDEFKLRRNELRRRNLSRQRELEKELPQPLLANLVNKSFQVFGR